MEQILEPSERGSPTAARGSAVKESPRIGYGPALHEPETVRGTQFHRRMLDIALPRTSWRFSLRDKLSRRGMHKLFHIFVRHHGARRIANFVRYLRQRERVVEAGYMPPLVALDLSNRCNLKCPGCATGLGLGRVRGSAGFDLARQVIDQVSGTALQLGFFHWGEPLLNRTAYQAIEYAVEQGLWTVVSTNLSFPIDRWLHAIFQSGLHDIVISCDGTTQDVYERYRKGGDVELVFKNLKRLRAMRDELGQRTPYLRAKMIVFEHNWHQIEEFRERALAAGADEVTYAFGYGGESYQTGTNGGGHYFDLTRLEWVRKSPAGACTEVWKEIFVGHDGAAFSCCLGYRDEDLFAGPADDGQIDVAAIWNNGHYRASRRFFAEGGPSTDLPKGCQDCEFVTAQVELQSTAPAEPQ
ncbi:MAG: radical SAM protein [Planctomycetes bacterium]|nr:radical SAM protein [Planctomycetota bacterium]